MPDELTPDIIAQTPPLGMKDVVDEDALLTELASLSPIAYDRRREEAAQFLNVRVSTLDLEVAARRPRQRDAYDAGTSVVFTDPEPWPDPVDGDELLDELTTTFARYAILPTGGDVALALWALYTYVHDAAYVSPILCLSSPQKRCGKTTVLSLLRAIVWRPLPASNITPAALFRTTELWQPTLLIDEADTFLRQQDELRGILNAGHTRDTAYVIRTVGNEHEPRSFCVWAPKAIALIGSMPPTLMDRSIMIPMQRKRPGEQVQRLRLDRLNSFLDLKSRCLRWAKDHREQLQNTDPAIPPGLHDREADNWRPLYTIAIVAGGAWPSHTQKAIQALTIHTLDDDDTGPLLLHDMACLFEERQADRLLSSDLAEALEHLDERPWPEWSRGKPITARQIARLLAPFGIRPRTLRTEGDRGKGYLKADCTDAFSRYLSCDP